MSTIEKDKRFLLFIHLWLITYLTLHQFLVPLASNLYHSKPFFYDTEPFFLLQFAFYFVLRKHFLTPIHRGLLNFGLFGSAIRLLTLGYSMIKFGVNWKFASIVLTEVSCVAFYLYNISLFTKERKSWGHPLSATLAVALGMGFFLIQRPDQEIMGHLKKPKFDIHKVEHSELEIQKWGCEGVTGDFGPEKLETQSQVQIRPCGFERVFSVVQDLQAFKIVNGDQRERAFKIFELRELGGGLKTRFLKRVSLSPGESYKYPKLESNKAYLLKSDTDKSIGVHVFAGADFIEEQKVLNFSVKYDQVRLMKRGV